MILNRLQSNEQKWAKTCAIWNKLHRACLRPAFWPQRRDIAKLEHELFSYGTCAQPRASFIKPELSLDMSWHTFLRDTVSTLIPACTPRNRQLKWVVLGLAWLECLKWVLDGRKWIADLVSWSGTDWQSFAVLPIIFACTINYPEPRDAKSNFRKRDRNKKNTKTYKRILCASIH